MINPKTTKDVSNIKLDDLIDFMKTKSSDEIAEFKTFANSTLKDGFGNDRKPCYFEVRNWVISKYFPDVVQTEKRPKATMIDRIMAL